MALVFCSARGSWRCPPGGARSLAPLAPTLREQRSGGQDGAQGTSPAASLGMVEAQRHSFMQQLLRSRPARRDASAA